MIKNNFIWLLFIFLTSLSCKSQHTEIKKNIQESKKEKKTLELGVDELTLTNLPSDTNEIHVELGMPSGDYKMFYIKNIPKSINNPIEKIKGLFVEVKSKENKNILEDYVDSFKVVNYHSYAFEINKRDWDILKVKADEIELKADTTFKNYSCEFCPHYLLGYNNKLIADKLTKDKMIEKLFNYMFSKYEAILFTSKK